MNEVPTNRQIEETARKYLKDRIKGSIFVKMKEKNNEEEIDTLYININSNGIVYTDELKLPGETFEMINQNLAFVETLASMVFDSFKKYIDSRFYVQDKPKTYRKINNNK